MTGRNVFDDVAPLLDDWFSRRGGSLEHLKGPSGGPPRPCVFVSYRSSNRDTAKDAARFLQARGLDVYFDKNDSCLSLASARHSDLGIAICLEVALNRSNALLSITTGETFTSPWPPYEIGSARGRSTFTRAIAPSGMHGLPTLPVGIARAHAIGHLIANGVTRVPEFVKLGVPITDLTMLRAWVDVLLNEKGLSPAVPSPSAPAGITDLPPSRGLQNLTFDL